MKQQEGMQILGIFIGGVYGWPFVGMLWTRILMFVALSLTLIFTLNEIIAQGFSNMLIHPRNDISAIWIYQAMDQMFAMNFGAHVLLLSPFTLLPCICFMLLSRCIFRVDEVTMLEPSNAPLIRLFAS